MDKIEKGPKEIFTPDIQKVSHRKIYKLIVPLSNITDAYEWMSESHMVSCELFVEAGERIEHVVQEIYSLWRKSCSWRDSSASSM